MTSQYPPGGGEYLPFSTPRGEQLFSSPWDNNYTKLWKTFSDTELIDGG